MESKEGKKSINMQGVMISVLFGGMLALGGCCLLLLLLAGVILMGVIPEDNMPYFCMALCAVSALIGGRFAVKKGEAPPILMGLMTGAFLCILILLIGYGGFPQPTMQGSGPMILLAALAGGGLAGLSGPRKKTKKKARKKR